MDQPRTIPARRLAIMIQQIHPWLIHIKVPVGFSTPLCNHGGALPFADVLFDNLCQLDLSMSTSM